MISSKFRLSLCSTSSSISYGSNRVISRNAIGLTTLYSHYESNLSNNNNSSTLIGDSLVQQQQQVRNKTTVRYATNGGQVQVKKVPRVKSSVRLRMQAASAKYQKPTLEIADAMPLSIQEMDNMSLVTMAAMNSHSAHVEMLKRHIMSVERISYDDAIVKFKEIQKSNDDYLWLIALPYRIGIVSGVTAATVSIPMVFHLRTAEWFNQAYVTTSIPEPEDIETILEVGSWTWSWCEPALGTVSFVLLALQFARAQIQNLGNKPYTAFVKHRRGERLASLYPQYDANLIIKYSKSTGFGRSTN